MSENRQRPEWLRSGLRYCELPEPPLVQKYIGGQPIDADSHYAETLSQENVLKLAAAGTEVVSIRFFAGFGLDFEAAEMDRGREFLSRARAAGITPGRSRILHPLARRLRIAPGSCVAGRGSSHVPGPSGPPSK
jgi:hypothetical protein